MSELQKVDNIANKLLLSIEEILKYSQLNNTPELVKNNNTEDDEEDDIDMESESDDEEDENSNENDILSRNLLRNINAKRHEVASIDSIEQIQVLHKHSRNVVKSIQELLLITKNLKEKWALKDVPRSINNENTESNTETTNDVNANEIKSCIENIQLLL
ncbi:uncharacterized protein HGUI_01856 [Hanseniaspora guilliermondii]|uniref:Uncharacterized protein n=1 Tax=Hanseniaspora guilliermondii TaxID=56406 RepID=A0A1L0AZU6_9ASCO|nr:uncharacterized protein HGUI_01856 [Hanseniaspora guilliermondii]